jgi:predicted alpha-1,2-mannosidase
MIQWSPETTWAFIKQTGSYEYPEDGIRGFSLTHLSGVGATAMGEVPIQPVVGGVVSSPASDAAAYLAKFSHSNEEASPGFYSVGFDNGVKVRLTVTMRAGIGNFSFPASTKSAILFNVGRNGSSVSSATIEITGERRITGSVSSRGFGEYTLYFVAEFNRPFSDFGTWKGRSVNKGQRFVRGPATGGWVGFNTTRDRKVGMKVALSYVSVANAWENLHAEIPGWDFDTVRHAAHNLWNRDLDRISVNGGTDDEKRVFYTALYHALLHPNIFTDLNNQYIGFDGKIHLAKGYTHYANISTWDIYRSELPLLALLFPKETSDMIQSLAVDAQQGGGLPFFVVANDEAGSMGGNPSCPIIAGAYAFGARSFDTNAALNAMLKGATDPNAKLKSFLQWDSLEDYLKFGYVGPDNRNGGPVSGPSQMLEFTTADFSTAQFAQALGDIDTYRTFMRRAQFWKNTFDVKTGYIAPRKKNGAFIPVDPANEHYYVEGNAAQYSWLVSYNLRGLFDLMGGNAKVVQRLDNFFTELNANVNRLYFFIGNEPCFPIPWAYDFAGAPWGAQSVTRRTELELFTTQPDGLPGNDDLGAMSSWYVFAALGLYPAIPGVGGFALNSPLFPSATVHLGDGKTIEIEGENASAANPYVQSLRVNGEPSEKTWLSYATLSQGATLQFELGNTPNKQWGTKPEDAPPSFSEGMEVSGN